MGVYLIPVLQWSPLSSVVFFIVVMNCGLGAYVFERVGFCELEVVFNWSEDQWTMGE